MTWHVFYFWWGDESTCDVLWHFCQSSKCTWHSHRERHVYNLRGGRREDLSPPLCAIPGAELQHHCILRGSPMGVSRLGWHRVANSAAALPQCYPKWEGIGYSLPCTRNWVRLRTFLQRVLILVGKPCGFYMWSFYSPTKAKDAFTRVRPAQHCGSSREYGKQHKWWKVSKKLTLFCTAVIPSPALFKPQIHTGFAR